MKPNKRDGQAIELSYECGESDEDSWIVRGHGQNEAAIEWATERYEYMDRDLPDTGFVIRDQWARWSMEPGPDGNGQFLRLYWESGPGRFPVTVAYDGDDWAREAERRRLEKEAKARIRSLLEVKFPDANVIDIGRYGHPTEKEGHWGARFRLPYLRFDATWYEGEPHIWINPIDKEAFEANRRQG